jgi:hypothetical protein
VSLFVDATSASRVNWLRSLPSLPLSLPRAVLAHRTNVPSIVVDSHRESSICAPLRRGNQELFAAADALTLPSLPSPAAWRPSVAGTADAWRRCCRCRHLWRSDPLSLLPQTRGDDAVAAISCGLATLRRCCSRRAATLPSLLTPLRRGNPPSLLLPTLPYPVAWRPSVAATTDAWRRYRCCRLLWRGNPPSLLTH